jgi:hypothetical protein
MKKQIVSFGTLFTLLLFSCSKDNSSNTNPTSNGFRVPGEDSSYVLVKINGQAHTIAEEYGSAQMERNADSVLFANIDNGKPTTEHKWFRVYIPKANKIGSFTVGKGIFNGYLSMILHDERAIDSNITKQYTYTANRDKGNATITIDKIVPNPNGNGMRYASGTFSGVVYNGLGDSLVLTEGVYADKRTR